MQLQQKLLGKSIIQLKYFLLSGRQVTNTVNIQVKLGQFYTYTYIYTYTLSGHFIRLHLASKKLDPFCLQNCLILNSSEILVHIDMMASRSCCRFVGSTSIMRISCSTTSQRCSMGLRSGDCGGLWSTVNSLSCSRNQFEMI